MCKLKPLVEYNVARSLAANGVDPCQYDEQEYDATLTPGENIHQILSSRGIRTVREWRAELARWREMAEIESFKSNSA